MRAIVTGSSGFVGSALSNQLLVAGWEVVGIDSHTDYYSPELKEFRLNGLVANSRFRSISEDICNLGAINQIVKDYQPHTIFHLAAQAGVRLPVTSINKYVESNLTGFSSVLQAAVSNNIPEFMYASSSSVYGNQAAIPYHEEERNLNPNSFYGATKLSNEVLAKSIIQNSQTKSRGMRFFTVYGPMGRPDMAYFRILASLLSDSSFDLFGDGSIQRDFTFVDDCVNSILDLQVNLQTKNYGFHDVVNIGGGNPVSMNDLLKVAMDLTGKELIYKSSGKNISDAQITNASSTYLISQIGKKPMTKLEEGIRKTIEWMSEEPQRELLGKWVRSSI
jgi:UDP-glucuronate 4-epimerase